MVKRKNPPAKGLWAIPGGRVKLGETLQEAAEREIMEETGVQIKARDVVYVFDIIDRDEKGAIHFHYVIIDFRADYISGEPEADDDVLEARWVSRSDLKELAVNPNTRQLLENVYNSKRKNN